MMMMTKASEPWCSCNNAPAEVGACCDHMPPFGEKAELTEALEAELAIRRQAQSIIGEYMPPDGIKAAEALNQLIGLFDGPQQREADAKTLNALMQRAV